VHGWGRMAGLRSKAGCGDAQGVQAFGQARRLSRNVGANGQGVSTKLLELLNLTRASSYLAAPQHLDLGWARVSIDPIDPSQYRFSHLITSTSCRHSVEPARRHRQDTRVPPCPCHVSWNFLARCACHSAVLVETVMLVGGLALALAALPSQQLLSRGYVRATSTVTCSILVFSTGAMM